MFLKGHINKEEEAHLVDNLPIEFMGETFKAKVEEEEGETFLPSNNLVTLILNTLFAKELDMS